MVMAVVSLFVYDCQLRHIMRTYRSKTKRSLRHTAVKPQIPEAITTNTFSSVAFAIFLSHGKFGLC